ncbi:unnamed protein product [Nyctereutes procyonoides]|uniref:(raccoon dog) hypothetical protein n=1 Tax=Nyctereutes procyonoides TaxID=34880 RepID=A0A811ZH75_NYCPR|nr:unnamed protein product [Nyctereutes procyonoides]
MQGARRGTRSRDSRVMPWAAGRCYTAKPPRDPPINKILKKKSSLHALPALKMLRVQLGTQICVLVTVAQYAQWHPGGIEREREAETQAEGEAGSMHREPDVGFDPGSPGSRPGPKAGAKPLRHPGIPTIMFIKCCFSNTSTNVMFVGWLLAFYHKKEVSLLY